MVRDTHDHARLEADQWEGEEDDEQPSFAKMLLVTSWKKPEGLDSLLGHLLNE